MGLIRKGVEQGARAIESIKKNRAGGGQLDVVIVGAGPAGLAASLAAKEAKLRFVTVEQEDGLGGSVYHYPRRKLAVTAPMTLPIIGKFSRHEISKEELLEFWNRVVKQTSLAVNFAERMDSLKQVGNGFIVKTSRAEYRAANVLLAIGRRGTPRKLGVPSMSQIANAQPQRRLIFSAAASIPGCSTKLR